MKKRLFGGFLKNFFLIYKLSENCMWKLKACDLEINIKETKGSVLTKSSKVITHSPVTIFLAQYNCEHNRIYPTTTKLKHFGVGLFFLIVFFTSGLFQLAFLLYKSDTLEMKAVACFAILIYAFPPFVRHTEALK